MEGFKDFMVFNKISSESVRTAAQYIKFRKFEDKELIFRQFDISSRFYGVLKGKVSICKNQNAELACLMRLKTKSSTNKLSFKRVMSRHPTIKFDIGKEILQFQSGHCFGHWGLLEKKERTASALSVGETYLFEMNRFGFEHSFKKDLNKAEGDKRNFILSLIPPLTKCSPHKFEEVYKSLVPVVKN